MREDKKYIHFFLGDVDATLVTDTALPLQVKLALLVSLTGLRCPCRQLLRWVTSC